MDFIICDNQFINNLIFELFQYDGYAKTPDFAWEYIDAIRMEILIFLTKELENSYALTNCFAEIKEDKALYQVKRIAGVRDLFVPVHLRLNKEEY